MKKISTLIYTTDLENISFVNECKKNGTNCISVIDARSAVYVATGISAQNRSKVAVCINASNESRSAFSGMTEAFYRKLSIALITIGNELNYTKELNDVVVGHYMAYDYDDVLECLDGEFPMHIELIVKKHEHKKMECDDLQIILGSLLDEETYLYISPGIKSIDVQYKGKIVYGGMPDCYDGAMANVLGASLAKKRKKYIGLVSVDEFIHDINTLGNININDQICYIIVTQKKSKVIFDYATAMKFEVVAIKNDDLATTNIKKIVLSKKKGLLMIYKEV